MALTSTHNRSPIALIIWERAQVDCMPSQIDFALFCFGFSRFHLFLQRGRLNCVAFDYFCVFGSRDHACLSWHHDLPVIAVIRTNSKACSPSPCLLEWKLMLYLVLLWPRADCNYVMIKLCSHACVEKFRIVFAENNSFDLTQRPQILEKQLTLSEPMIISS